MTCKDSIGGLFSAKDLLINGRLFPMIAETIFQTANPRQNLTVRIKVVRLDSPRSVEAMEETLREHVLECRHCLAFALFDEHSLAEMGCDNYRRMLSQMEAELQVQNSLKRGAHVSEQATEEYCFNLLSEQETANLEEHMKACEACASRMGCRQDFIQCVKAALREWTTEVFDTDSLNGVMGIHAPDMDLSLWAPILA